MYESAYQNAALNGLSKEILWSLFRFLRSDLVTLQKLSHTCVHLRTMALIFLSESPANTNYAFIMFINGCLIHLITSSTTDAVNLNLNKLKILKSTSKMDFLFLFFYIL